AVVAAFLADRVRTAAIRRAPQAGVAARGVHQLQLGVVAVEAPHGTTTTLPLIARVAGDADVLTGDAVFRMLLVRVLRQAHVLVAAGVLTLPDLLAVGQVVGSEAATRRELVTTETDEHLALSNERRRCDGLALVGVGVLDDPHFLARGRI